MPNKLRIAWCLIAASTVVGCSRNDSPQKKGVQHNPPEKKVPNQPEQKTTALTEADQKRLRDQRAVVERYLGNEESKQKYKTAAGKLGTIRAILQADVFKRDQTYELQCLGI